MDTVAPPSPARYGRPRTIVCTDPATGDRLGEVPIVSAEALQERVARAREAQVSWGKTPFEQRRRVLRALLEVIVEQTDEICDLVVHDAGKTHENAILGEIWPVCEKLRWTIAHGERHLRPEAVSSGLLVHKRATIQFQPLGVIGVISPWNFPFQNILGPTIPALFAGNAVIVKASEWSSWSAAPIQQLFDRVLLSNGHAKDLVQVVTGDAETGAALVSSGVEKIVFTGSMANGRKVLEHSARTLTPVILELGGKDPMIVCDDADLDVAVHAALAGTFIASGQMCLAAERIYAFERIHDQFVELVVAATRRLRQGPPRQHGEIDVGAMTMPGQLDIVQKLVDDAVSKGARVEVGGHALGHEHGRYYAPTVLTNVNHSMAIMREETFGPVMAIVRVSSEQQAIELANDTEYGLGSTVFSRDRVRAERIAAQLVTGSTCINDFGLPYMVQALPFGGVRGSGFGRLNGREGLRAFTNEKAVLSDRFNHGPVTLYPVRRGDYERARAVIQLLYGTRLAQRLRGAYEFGRTVMERSVLGRYRRER